MKLMQKFGDVDDATVLALAKSMHKALDNPGNETEKFFRAINTMLRVALDELIKEAGAS